MRAIEIVQVVRRRRRSARVQMRQAGPRLGMISTRLGLGLALLIMTALLTSGVIYARLTAGLPSLDQLPASFEIQNGGWGQPTRLYDRSGTRLVAEINPPGGQRLYYFIDPAQPQHFSPALVQVVVGLMEPGFWSGSGVSWRTPLETLPFTIAERLSDDILLETETTGSIRALRMRMLAGQITARFGRAQLLEWYLNSASFGHGTYGASSAARLYLNKPASEINLAEAAVLAAAIEAPALNPLDAPDAARDRGKSVLARLKDSGVVSLKDYENAFSQNVIFAVQSDPKESTDGLTARAFSNLVLDQLSERVGRRLIERGGLRVTTTLDFELQRQAACLTSEQLARIQKKSTPAASLETCSSAHLLPPLPEQSSLSDADETSAALVALDPRSGEILALVGDTTSDGEQSVLSGHPTGSILAPFAALTAFARGAGPATLLWDIPGEIPPALETQSADFHGPVRLRLALVNDYLPALTSLLIRTGPAETWQQAALLGIPQPGPKDDPAAYLFEGGSSSPLQIAQAYSVLSNLGVSIGQPRARGGLPLPTALVEAEDSNGRIVYSFRTPETQSILIPSLAYLVNHILSDENARKPWLGNPSPFEIARPAAAKLGKTASGRQAWAAGYTPQRLVVSVFSLPEKTIAENRIDPMAAAGLWRAVMQTALRDLPAEVWTMPPGVSTLQVCDPSGLLPSTACPTVVQEVFLSGSEPVSPDTLYKKVQINRETGKLATVFTPLELVDERTFLTVPPEARAWAEKSGLPAPPRDYDILQPPAPIENVRITSPEPFAYVSGKIQVSGWAAGPDFASFRLQAGQGINPSSWSEISPVIQNPVQDGQLAVWDTSGLEGLYALRLIVMRQNRQIESAVIQITVDNTPPAIRLIYPVSGQTLTPRRGEPVIFQASIDENVGIKKIIWSLDGAPLSEQFEPPFSQPWQPVPGKHSLNVQAIDLAGNSSTSETVEFNVE